MTLPEWLESRDACSGARRWVAANPDASVATCPRGEWLLWLAFHLGYGEEECAQAVRPAVLRALRVYASDALDAAGLGEHAAKLRALPDDADLEACASAARAAAWAAESVARAELAAESVARAEWAAEWAVQAAKAAAESAESAEWASESAEWASESAEWASESARVAEHAKCADDVRAAFPGLQARLDEVLG